MEAAVAAVNRTLLADLPPNARLVGSGRDPVGDQHVIPIVLRPW